MAKLIQNNYDLKLATYTELQDLSPVFDGMYVTVMDATADGRCLPGSTVVYKYIIEFAGTEAEWMIISQTDEESITIIKEDLLIASGSVTLSNTPVNNILFDVVAKWVENGVDFVEDVDYTISGTTVSVSTTYNGKILSVKYIKNVSGKIYSIDEAIDKQIAVTAANFDLSTASLFTKTISANTTFTVSGVGSTGKVSSFMLELTNGGAYTVTWFAGVKWAGGTAPTLTAAGTDIICFYTYDGGTTWRGLVAAQDIK